MSLKKQLVIAAKERSEFARLYRRKLSCPDCPGSLVSEDGFCHTCGMDVRNIAGNLFAKWRDEKQSLFEADRAAADRRDEKVRELVEKADNAERQARKRLDFPETRNVQTNAVFEVALNDLRAAIAAVREDLK